MFKNISNKNKLYLLILFVLLLSFTAYKRSFKGTIDAIIFYKDSKKNIAESSASTIELENLKNEIEDLDNIIGKKAKYPMQVQNEILGFLSSQDENVTIAQIEAPNISDDSYFTIYSNLITLKGDFNSLLKTIYEFEINFEYARIANMVFRVDRNPKTSKTELFTDIIFQNYEKKQ